MSVTGKRWLLMGRIHCTYVDFRRWRILGSLLGLGQRSFCFIPLPCFFQSVLIVFTQGYVWVGSQPSPSQHAIISNPHTSLLTWPQLFELLGDAGDCFFDRQPLH